MPNIFYRYKNKWVTLGTLCGRVKKHPGKAKILASVIVETKQGQEVKIVFVRHRQKEPGRLSMSTKTNLPDKKIVRIYGKRWDIEVFSSK